MNNPGTERRYEPAGLTLEGEVRGASTGQARVTLTITDRAGAQVARTGSGSDGRFRFEGLAPGSYVVVATGAGYRPCAEVVRLGAGSTGPLRITLESVIGVHGLVYDRGSGSPVPGATVSAVGTGGEVLANTVAGPGGEYRITGVDAAELTLVASAAGAEPVATPVRRAGDDPQSPVDLPVDAHSRITGTVTGAAGEPVASMALTLLDEHGRTVASTVSDEEGRYAFDGVSAGTYTLHSPAVAPRATPIPPETTIADVTLPLH